MDFPHLIAAGQLVGVVGEGGTQVVSAVYSEFTAS